MGNNLFYLPSDTPLTVWATFHFHSFPTLNNLPIRGHVGYHFFFINSRWRLINMEGGPNLGKVSHHFDLSYTHLVSVFFFVAMRDVSFNCYSVV